MTTRQVDDIPEAVPRSEDDGPVPDRRCGSVGARRPISARRAGTSPSSNGARSWVAIQLVDARSAYEPNGAHRHRRRAVAARIDLVDFEPRPQVRPASVIEVSWPIQLDEYRPARVGHHQQELQHLPDEHDGSFRDLVHLADGRDTLPPLHRGHRSSGARGASSVAPKRVICAPTATCRCSRPAGWPRQNSGPCRALLADTPVSCVKRSPSRSVAGGPDVPVLLTCARRLLRPRRRQARVARCAPGSALPARRDARPERDGRERARRCGRVHPHRRDQVGLPGDAWSARNRRRLRVSGGAGQALPGPRRRRPTGDAGPLLAAGRDLRAEPAGDRRTPRQLHLHQHGRGDAPGHGCRRLRPARRPSVESDRAGPGVAALRRTPHRAEASARRWSSSAGSSSLVRSVRTSSARSCRIRRRPVCRAARRLGRRTSRARDVPLVRLGRALVAQRGRLADGLAVAFAVGAVAGTPWAAPLAAIRGTAVATSTGLRSAPSVPPGVCGLAEVGRWSPSGSPSPSATRSPWPWVWPICCDRVSHVAARPELVGSARTTTFVDAWALMIALAAVYTDGQRVGRGAQRAGGRRCVRCRYAGAVRARDDRRACRRCAVAAGHQAVATKVGCRGMSPAGGDGLCCHRGTLDHRLRAVRFSPSSCSGPSTSTVGGRWSSCCGPRRWRSAVHRSVRCY